MSNVITGNPLILDTAAATTVISSQIRITKVVLQSGASGVAGDALVLKDQRGVVKVDIAIAAAKETRSENFAPPLYMDGLAITTLTHGTAYVYWDGPQPVA